MHANKIRRGAIAHRRESKANGGVTCNLGPSSPYPSSAVHLRASAVRVLELITWRVAAVDRWVRGYCRTASRAGCHRRELLRPEGRAWALPLTAPGQDGRVRLHSAAAGAEEGQADV